MEAPKNRLIIVSNRLPIVLREAEKGWEVQPGSGGLVTALAPVLKDRGGVWIGWSGVSKDKAPDTQSVLSHTQHEFGYTLVPITLTRGQKENYYEGFANQVIWPLFHDFSDSCHHEPEYWQTYLEVNRKFARTILSVQRQSDLIWVHDYHLMGVADALRKAGVKGRIAFFLHIPFPPVDIFIKLPWRFQILNFLLQYDVIGFQTPRDRRNFIQCVRRLVSARCLRGRGQVLTLKNEGREIRIGFFPIGIDFNEFSELAASQQVSDKAWYLHEELAEQQIILGVDRLDYTKGILERLKAYRSALRRYPELQENTTLVQLVVPSRRNVPEYETLKIEIERLVGEINGEFTKPGWVPIHYLFRSLEREELLAYYRTAEIALITPLKDGMNLVAKEYCASNIEENGVLILSEFAGAAYQLQKHALLVNPHDIEGIADAIHRAFTMSQEERRYRMQRLRRLVKQYNIFWWVESFLRAAFARDLSDFPLLDGELPQEPLVELISQT